MRRRASIARALPFLAIALMTGVASGDPLLPEDAQAITGIGSEAPSLSILRVGAALLATLAAVLLVSAILRRTPMGRRGSTLGVEHRLSVARGGSVAVIHVENRRLLLGITPSQISLITELDERAAGESAASTTAQRPFERWLAGSFRASDGGEAK